MIIHGHDHSKHLSYHWSKVLAQTTKPIKYFKTMSVMLQSSGENVNEQWDLLKAVFLSGDILQVLLQSLAKLAELLLGHHHLLTDQQQGLWRGYY